MLRPDNTSSQQSGHSLPPWSSTGHWVPTDDLFSLSHMNAQETYWLNEHSLCVRQDQKEDLSRDSETIRGVAEVGSSFQPLDIKMKFPLT